ncbi:PAS domain-containing protein, partial [Chamaesiphon sp. VAR_69_metabat_338]|uniref:PAS domain-containing protein n=1 Tax=Chamaesiphon sp. VAR_69_metabat_338 TaxID=2964704 RepID=UPI00286EAEB8
MTSSQSEIAANSIFVRGSEMADLMRAHDWSQTPLGAPSGWSQSLKTVLSILLTSQHPIFLWWGQELIQFYNDAYRPILGTTKHPQALGQRGRECWQEIWETIAPMIAAVVQRGEATQVRDGLLLLERNGYLEECYFNYAYSPVRDEAGEVGGIFCACDETTKRVIGERQLKTLRELAAQPLTTKTIEEAGRACMSAIAANPADIPFALLYQLDELGSAQLLGTAGIAPGTLASPDRLDLTAAWDLDRVRQSGEAAHLTDLATRFDTLPESIWNLPPQSAYVVPLERSGQQQLAGLLILAVSPCRAFEEEYRGFFEVIGSQVEIAIANARAHQEERQRTEALAALDRIVSSLRDGFATFDRQWRYTYINDRLLEFLKLPRLKVIGRQAWDVFPHQVGIEFYDLLQRAMTEQIEVQFEFYYAVADMWVEHRLYPTTDGLAILMADISERKRAELLLFEQKRLLELVATGEPLANCLAAVCASVSNLSLGVRACILPADAQRHKFPRSISPELPPAFALGVANMPLDDLTIGVCAPAVYAGRSVTCVDIVNDDLQLPSWRDLCAANGILACHCAPILGVDELPLGSLMLCFDRSRVPTEWEYQLAEFGTNIASIVFERERTSLALQSSEAKYRTLFESMDEGL